MPCVYHVPRLEERYPSEWIKSKNIVSNQMILDGWSKYAKKFDEVMKRKAKRLLIEKLHL